MNDTAETDKGACPECGHQAHGPVCTVWVEYAYCWCGVTSED